MLSWVTYQLLLFFFQQPKHRTSIDGDKSYLLGNNVSDNTKLLISASQRQHERNTWTSELWHDTLTCISE